MNTPYEYVMRALERAKGDDLEPYRLDEQWGESGRTRREILEEYRNDREQWERAVEWLCNDTLLNKADSSVRSALGALQLQYPSTELAIENLYHAQTALAEMKAQRQTPSRQP